MIRYAMYAIAFIGWIAFAALIARVTPIDYYGRIGVFGTVATVIGLVYTFYQLAQTRAAADAAHDSADRTAKKIRRARVAQLLSRILDNLRELDGHVKHESWADAGVRCETLSFHVNELASLPPPDETWLRIATNLQDWSGQFSSQESGRINVAHWRRLRNRVFDKASKEYQVAVAENENE